VLVSRLRQKLGDDPRRPTFIRTVWGVGYSFIGGAGA
jgi:two-component system, OmpR family, phosphate regulon response regulator OmpR